MKSIARSLRITSKKLNLVADLVRTKDATSAMSILKFTPKKGAKILGKVIRSAVANAETNFKQEPASLYIKEIIITEGQTLKRSVPVSRGRQHPILKRCAHATVILGVRDENGETEKPNNKSKRAAKAQKAAESATPATPETKAPKSRKPSAKKTASSKKS